MALAYAMLPSHDSGPATNAPPGAQHWMVCVYLPMYFLGLPGQAVTFSVSNAVIHFFLRFDLCAYNLVTADIGGVSGGDMPCKCLHRRGFILLVDAINTSTTNRIGMGCVILWQRTLRVRKKQDFGSCLPSA